MKGFLKVILVFFFFFFFVLIGSELVRWNNYKEMMYKEIEIASLDAMEVTVDDKLKKDHILYIEDTELTKEIVEKLIKKNVNVSLKNSSVIRSNHFIHEIRISRFEIFPGQYHLTGNIPVQDKVPEVIVEGEFDLTPFIARTNNFYFKTKIENRTEAIFTD